MEDSATPPSPLPPAQALTTDRVRVALNHPFKVGFTVTLGVLAALMLGTAISNLSTVLVYMLLAMFAALGLEPAVGALTRRGIGRGSAIAIVFVAFALVIVGIMAFIIPTVVTQIAEFAKAMPQIVHDVQASQWFAWVEDRFGDGASDAITQITNFVTNPSNLAALGGGVVHVGVSVASLVSGWFITLILALYFLSSLPWIKSSFYQLTPARGRASLARMTDQVTESIGGYLGALVIIAACNALATFCLQMILHLPFPVLMSVLAFLITLIPMVGSAIFLVLASVLALFTGVWPAVIFAVSYLVYTQIEAWVIYPRIMTRAIEIPGVLVVVGALVGGTLMGLIGALVAIPITASLLLVIKQVWIPKQDAKTGPDPDEALT